MVWNCPELSSLHCKVTRPRRCNSVLRSADIPVRFGVNRNEEADKNVRAPDPQVMCVVKKEMSLPTGSQPAGL
jgi:hypothetical protein